MRTPFKIIQPKHRLDIIFSLSKILILLRLKIPVNNITIMLGEKNGIEGPRFTGISSSLGDKPPGEGGVGAR